MARRRAASSWSIAIGSRRSDSVIESVIAGDCASCSGSIGDGSGDVCGAHSCRPHVRMLRQSVGLPRFWSRSRFRYGLHVGPVEYVRSLVHHGNGMGLSQPAGQRDSPGEHQEDGQALASGPSVFLSYRWSDTGDVVGDLAVLLRRDLGGAQIFRDRDDLLAGEPLNDVIAQRLASSDAALFLVGRNWLGTEDGVRRRSPTMRTRRRRKRPIRPSRRRRSNAERPRWRLTRDGCHLPLTATAPPGSTATFRWVVSVT